MNVGDTASRFPNTSWTALLSAPANPQALQSILKQYWGPLYAYLRKKGRNSQDAADLVQGFIADVVLQRNLLTKADQSRGKFRSFLIAAIDNYSTDRFRKQLRDAQSNGHGCSLDSTSLEAFEPGNDAEDPSRVFDRHWAATVLNLALQRLEQECCGDGMATHWQVFEAWFITPVRNNTKRPPIESVMRDAGVDSAQEIYSMQQTMKRKLNRKLREVIAQTVTDASQVDEEFAELKEFLVS